MKYQLKFSLYCSACSWTTFELLPQICWPFNEDLKAINDYYRLFEIFLNSIGIVFISLLLSSKDVETNVNIAIKVVNIGIVV